MGETMSSEEIRAIADDVVEKKLEREKLLRENEALKKQLEAPGPGEAEEEKLKKRQLDEESKGSAQLDEKKKRGILETGHENVEDLLACPECLLGHIKKIGFDRAAVEICKDDEACKANIAELIKKGYKIEEPERPKTDSEIIGEAFPEEREGRGGFILGRGSVENE